VNQQDANSITIVSVLRQAGCTVDYIESSVGRAGIPDIVVGREGRNWLLEIKTKRGRVSEAQKAWQAGWRGQVAVVRTPFEALAAIGLTPEGGPR
jgi:hypothetical protein